MNMKLKVVGIALSALCINFASAKIVDSKKMVTAKPVKSGAIYRGNVGRTGVFNKNGVTGKPSVKWKVDLGGKIVSSPVVWNGTLFVGGKKGLYALDSETGKEKWVFNVKKGVDSSVVVADGMVYFTGNDGGLYGVNVEDGKKVWVVKGGRKGKFSDSFSTQPLVIYGMVICSMGGKVIAVDYKTGKKIWTKKGGAPEAYNGIIANKDRFFHDSGYSWCQLQAFDFETAERLFTKGGGGIGKYNIPAVRGDRIYSAGTSSIVCNKSDNLSKSHLEDASRPIWSSSLLKKRVEDNEYVLATSPTIWKNLVFVGSQKGYFYAFDDDKKGKKVWEKNIGDQLLSAPSVADKSGIVYFGSHDSNLYALDAATGNDKWKFKTGGIIQASPWIEDGVVYISSFDGCVYALK